MESTTGKTTGMTKCAVAFRRGLLLGLFVTAALAAMGLWAANVVQAHAHHAPPTEQARTAG